MISTSWILYCLNMIQKICNKSLAKVLSKIDMYLKVLYYLPKHFYCKTQDSTEKDVRKKKLPGTLMTSQPTVLSVLPAPTPPDEQVKHNRKLGTCFLTA